LAIRKSNSKLFEFLPDAEGKKESEILETTEKNFNSKMQKRKLILLLSIVGVLVATIFIFSCSTALSERYMQTVYPVVASMLSFVSGLLPFSLYDVFLIVASLLLIKLIVFAVIRKITFSAFLFSFIRFVAIIVAWFYLSWGIAYFRKDFYNRCHVQEIKFEEESLKTFAVRFIDDANRQYVDCSNMDKEDIRREIEQSYRLLHPALKTPYPNGKRRVKPMMFEPVYSKTGVSGYFGPFFNEIHVNNYSLNFTYPFTLAHEMAHQFGIAPESEANLYAFIVCAGSDNDKIRYSAYASALRYVLGDVRRFLPDDYQSMVSSIRPEIMADMERNREHWLAVRDESLSGAQDKMYDAYLKTNKIRSGQGNYSEVVGLLISSYGIIQ
jgi:flagellar basal body-associated protein FliL